ncbi:hypothetical protein HDU67_003997 [Dinochytrium kinnereticum]|nr:hypothetical protein HDU67_003997 [Dinochytrium kinnereticum]
MQIEDNGLLGEPGLGRFDRATRVTTSSFNQRLFIGTNEKHKRPSKLFIKIHELLARIVHMLGATDWFFPDEDDDAEMLYGAMEPDMDLGEKVERYFKSQHSEMTLSDHVK